MCHKVPESKLLICFLITGIIGIGPIPFFLGCKEAHSEIRNSPMGIFLAFMFSFFFTLIFHCIFSYPVFYFYYISFYGMHFNYHPSWTEWIRKQNVLGIPLPWLILLWRELQSTYSTLGDRGSKDRPRFDPRFPGSCDHVIFPFRPQFPHL